MQNQETMQQEKNNKFKTFDYEVARVQICLNTEGLTDEETSEYYSDRATEFYDNYDFTAEPSETAKILTKNSVKAMMAEFEVFIAQKEQFMNYMGVHKAETFGTLKPSELLKEFGQWLVDSAEHADWDYEDWD